MTINHHFKIKKYLLFLKYKELLVLMVILITPSEFTHAQSNIPDSVNFKDSLSNLQFTSKIDTAHHEKDLIDVLRKGLKIKNVVQPEISSKNSLGPFLSFLPAVGYAIASGYIAALNSNISFYTGRKVRKISSVLIGIYYSQYNQYWSVINSNIYTKNENLNFIGDWRIYKFPTQTFGLGSSSLPVNADKIDYNYLKIYQVVLQKVFPNLFIGLGYHLDYHSGIREINIMPVITDIQKYGYNIKSNSSGISLNFLCDSRTSSINPLKGTYCNLQLRHNFTFLGSDNSWKSIIIDAREYLKFPAKSRNVLAFWSYNYFTYGYIPYLDMPSTGWDAYNNTGRGYAQGRFRGKNLIYFESEYRFSLTRNGLFGGVVFVNVESLTEWPKNNFGIFVPGYGVGARIKINKRSGTNVAIDYGIGNHGSKGFSFNLGELF